MGHRLLFLTLCHPSDLIYILEIKVKITVGRNWMQSSAMENRFPTPFKFTDYSWPFPSKGYLPKWALCWNSHQLSDKT